MIRISYHLRKSLSCKCFTLEMRLNNLYRLITVLEKDNEENAEMSIKMLYEA